jgi:hypothetical protein
MALSKTTQDHDIIRKWAEKRGAQPAEVAGTHKGNEPGILRFCFPKAKNHNDSNLKEISWEDFFEKFDENNLELVYQEKTAEGAESNFNKLVHPTEDEHSSRKSSKDSHTKASSSKASSSKGSSTASSGSKASSSKSSGHSGSGRRRAA